MSDRAIVAVQATVGHGGAFNTVLLQAGVAGGATATAVYHAAHAHQVAGFEVTDLWPNGGNPANNFMARNDRIF